MSLLARVLQDDDGQRNGQLTRTECYSGGSRIANELLHMACHPRTAPAANHVKAHSRCSNAAGQPASFSKRSSRRGTERSSKQLARLDCQTSCFTRPVSGSNLHLHHTRIDTILTLSNAGECSGSMSTEREGMALRQARRRNAETECYGRMPFSHERTHSCRHPLRSVPVRA